MSGALGPPPSSEGLDALRAASSSGQDIQASSSSTVPSASQDAGPSRGSTQLPRRGSVPSAPSEKHRPSPLAASAHAVSPAPISSASLAAASPNHPANLRRYAKAELDSKFTLKSYVGAAYTLYEKAESDYRQNEMERAFVNYLKCAKVASQIPRHAEWPMISRVRQDGTRDSLYKTYQDFMQKVPGIIERTERIEKQLQAREDAREAARSDQASSTAASQSQPEQVASEIDAGLIEGQAAASHEDVELVNGAGSAPREVNSLADRLSALRSNGMAAARQGDSGVGASGPSSNRASALLALGSEHGHRRDPTDGDVASRLPRPATPTQSPRAPGDDRSGLTSPVLRPSESWSAPSMGSLMGRIDTSSGRTTPTQKQESPTSVHLPTVSEFTSSYPALEDFERAGPSEHDQSRHQNGSATSAPPRPLPPPPVSHAAGPSRPPLPLPAGTSVAGESTSIGRPNDAELPPLPRSNLITVEELWTLLHPGFASVSVPAAEAASETPPQTRMVRKPGRRVLLLDVRSRQQWTEKRIAVPTSAGTCVRIDPMYIKQGISSEEMGNMLAASGVDSAQREAFENRHTFDLVVLCDSYSRGLVPQSNLPPAVVAAAEILNAINTAIYEREFAKPLRHHPVLLVGGVESWSRKVDASYVAGSRGADAGSVDSAQAAHPQQRRDSQPRDDDARRLRRQGLIVPEGMAPPALASSTEGPKADADQLPSRLALPSYAPPSMPVRAYQSGYSSSNGPPSYAPPMGAPAFPPPAPSAVSSGRSSRQSDYHTSQPHIPCGDPANQHATSRASANFEYPRLRNGHAGTVPPHDERSSGLTPPPAAAASNGMSSSSRAALAAHGHGHTGSLSVLPTSLQSGAASQHAARGSMDLTRRPPLGALGSSLGSKPSSYSAGAPSSPSATPASANAAKLSNDVRVGMTGLKNVGNSCYMNATLQCLSATVPLARFLLDGSYKRAINRVNPLGTQGALAEAFAQLIRVMWSESYTFVSPVTFREAITRFAPAFRGYDQHDAQEFLAFLLDGLHEDLNHVVHKPPPVEMTPAREHELETLPQQIASVKEWGIYRQRNDSFVVDWFQGQFRNKLTCCTCGKTSTTYNAFMYLSLPIPTPLNGSKGRVTLHQCLDAFVREEVMDKADAWHCPACKKPRKAIKRLTISRLPQILLVHLKRFAFRAGTDKVQTAVDFPINDVLDLTNYMPSHAGILPRGAPVSASQQPPYLYRLAGVVHHFGTLNTGHYTASVRSQGHWHYADDSRVVKQPDVRQLQSSSPYILWFSRLPNS
ncbi:hypothetical protein IE81DRAFT_313348 [Ceraceosorus guamensis]|uniref:ubiquitinyl hydrolase 1 n=1 Tax=Ceraceosorus guamensis TaxID=1522189 RepID=A0A316VYJ9_9BASI|nr:hypothetical protein IE81DRAFT_313348 [Ceraceosorus guamensis]PWN42529.1 hypothetical protein IE81DRAFT_313348 [Ceraceosorus guamensis]